VNPVLEKILKTGRTMSPDGESIEVKTSSISFREGEFLQKLIGELQPVETLEVGLAYGVSALFICDALQKVPNSRHIIMDPSQHNVWKDIGLHNLREAGYEKMIEFYPLPSHQALQQLVAEGRKIDFAFVDGWHTFDYTLVDFFFIDKMLKVGGMVVLDDTNWPGIRKVCRYIATSRAYSVRSMRPADSSKLSIRHLLLDNILRIPGISKPLRNILKPELIESDIKLGLRGSCIAFKKEAEDTRRWDFHQPF